MNKKKIYWFVNAIIFNLSRFIYKRDSFLWVYGSLNGIKYDDNSRALFEYVNSRYSKKIRSVWLTKEEKTVSIVRQSNGEAYTFDSRKGKAIARKAGVAFFTHSLADFGACPQVGGAKLVFLGHGAAFKQTCNAKRHGFTLFLKKIIDMPFSWIQRDITISTSALNMREEQKIGGLKNQSRMYITGQPRNDIFRNFEKRKEILDILGINYNKKIILYMPTYRMDSMGEHAMNDIILDLFNSSVLDRTLDDGGYVFVVKPHPKTPRIKIDSRDNFRVLDYYNVDSNQDLLACGDMLVTDYSSCCVDFALTEKPVLFFRPDEDKFLKYSETVCEEYFMISDKNSSRTVEELAQLIEKPSFASTVAINELYEDSSIKGTCYSANVFRLICKQMGIELL